MTQPDLFSAPVPQIADTSLEAWRTRILPSLTRRELLVYRALVALCATTGDATGGELTEWLRARGEARDVNGVRPRLTGLADKGWIAKLEPRRCRAYTTSARPYRPLVPLSALHDLNPKDGGQ